jgi:predicted Fe-Mo cluster-binding NifX family protein
MEIKNMKIAVASQNKSSLTEHTGKCQKFWIYEVNSTEILSKELLELPKEQSFHNSSPHDLHPLDNIQVLISEEMGKGLLRRLEKRGIEAIVTEESEPDFVVNAYFDGFLVRKTLESCQHEHEHRHNHQHRHRHAHK